MVSHRLPASLCSQHSWWGQAAALTQNGWYGCSFWAPPPLACPLTFSQSGVYITVGRRREGPWQPKWSLCCLCAVCCLCWPCLLQVWCRAWLYIICTTMSGFKCWWMYLRGLLMQVWFMKWKGWSTAAGYEMSELCVSCLEFTVDSDMSLMKEKWKDHLFLVVMVDIMRINVQLNELHSLLMDCSFCFLPVGQSWVDIRFKV